MSQLTITQFKSLYGSSGTTFPDNTTGQISESDMRQFGEDIADSTPMGIPITSGTYTPTLTNVVNVDSSQGYDCQYMRVGLVVTVSGKFDVDPTTVSVETRLEISLPIASDFENEEECAGVVANGEQDRATIGHISAQIANNRALVTLFPNDDVSYPFYFTFTYQIRT